MQVKKRLALGDFYQMEALEKKYYHIRWITPAQVAYKWFQVFPESTLALEEGGEILGVMNLFPITKKTSEGLLRGSLCDASMDESYMARPLIDGSRLDLFLSCLVVELTLRKRGGTLLLLQAYLEVYEAYERQGMVFDWVITDNVTQEGVAFSKRMGFIWVKDTDHGSSLYMQPYDQWKEAVKNHGKKGPSGKC